MAVVGIAAIVLVELLDGRPEAGEWILAIVLGQHAASTLRGQARDGR